MQLIVNGWSELKHGEVLELVCADQELARG